MNPNKKFDDIFDYAGMVLKSVESSNIKGYAYDDENEMLIVAFKNGNGQESRYLYVDVPLDLMEEFETADSKGKFVRSHIIGKYESIKLDIGVL